MGNQELLDYFSSYAAVRARHSYGPQGHRGMSVLIFEASGSGYYEAERLHKLFAEQGTDRDAWASNRRILFLHGGNRQLYGYMATKEDLDLFNRHSQGSVPLFELFFFTILKLYKCLMSTSCRLTKYSMETKYILTFFFPSFLSVFI